MRISFPDSVILLRIGSGEHWMSKQAWMYSVTACDDLNWSLNDFVSPFPESELLSDSSLLSSSSFYSSISSSSMFPGAKNLLYSFKIYTVPNFWRNFLFLFGDFEITGIFLLNFGLLTFWSVFFVVLMKFCLFIIELTSSFVFY